MTTPDLIVERTDPCLRVTLNRPAKHNALTLDMLEGLMAATQLFAGEDSLQVLLVRAIGPSFSSGIDLTGGMMPDRAIRSQRSFRRWYRAGTGCIHPLGDLWEAIEKPVVVAHQGPCLGGALELSLCADFRIASEAARYGLPEIAFGGLPGSGGISRLTRLAGPQWARWIALANQSVSAERALAIGLVHEVHAPDSFEAAVTAFCDTLARIPAEAFAAGKVAVDLAADLGRAEARNIERLAASALVTGDEYHRIVEDYIARFARKDG